MNVFKELCRAALGKCNQDDPDDWPNHDWERSETKGYRSIIGQGRPGYAAKEVYRCRKCGKTKEHWFA